MIADSVLMNLGWASAGPVFENFYDINDWMKLQLDFLTLETFFYFLYVLSLDWKNVLLSTLFCLLLLSIHMPYALNLRAWQLNAFLVWVSGTYFQSIWDPALLGLLFLRTQIWVWSSKVTGAGITDFYSFGVCVSYLLGCSGTQVQVLDFVCTILFINSFLTPFCMFCQIWFSNSIHFVWSCFYLWQIQGLH